MVWFFKNIFYFPAWISSLLEFTPHMFAQVGCRGQSRGLLVTTTELPISLVTDRPPNTVQNSVTKWGLLITTQKTKKEWEDTAVRRQLKGR